MLSMSHHEIESGNSYFKENILNLTGTGSLIGQNIGGYQLPPIESRFIDLKYIQSSTLVVHPIYTSTKFSELSKIIELHPSIKHTLDKEIESDDFLKEFFSTTKKMERMPTLEQIKEQYYSR